MEAVDMKVLQLQMRKLFQSIRSRDVKMIEKLLIHGVPHIVNYLDAVEGQTALTLATSRSDVLLAELLLEHGALPDLKDSMGRTPLMIAASKGSLSLLRVLIQHRADVNMADNKGRGALFHCLTTEPEAGLTCLEDLIADGADVNSTTYQGESLLVAACSKPHETSAVCCRICSTLLEHGADHNSKNEVTNYTALMSAVSNQHEDVVRILLQSNANPNDFTSRRVTACHLAAETGNITILRLLAGFGADFNIISDTGETPLHAAARTNQTTACKFIGQRGCDANTVNKKGQLARHIALEANDHQTAKVCRKLEKLANRSPDNFELWIIRLYDFSLQHQNQLLERFGSYDVIRSGKISRTEFMEAVKEASTHAVGPHEMNLRRVALMHEADELVDYKEFLSGKKYVKKQYREFESKAHHKSKKIKNKDSASRGGVRSKAPVCVCTNHLGDRQMGGGPPLPYVKQREKIVDRVTPGIQSNDHKYSNDLHWYCRVQDESYIRVHDAVRHDQWDTVVGSMKGRDKMATCDARDRYGKTPLMIAAQQGNLDMTKYLIAAGADVTARDNFNWTALHFGCQAGHLELDQFLLDSGASIDATSLCGATPLMRAVESGRVELVQLLVKRGASVSAANRAGNTALDISISLGDFRIYDIIKQECDKIKEQKVTSDEEDNVIVYLTVETQTDEPAL